MNIDDFIKQELIASFQRQFKKSELVPHLETDTTRIIDFITQEFVPKSATITFNPINNFAFLSILYDSKILYMYIQFYQSKKTTVKIVSTDGKKEKTVFKGTIDEFVELYRKK
jgi:hypothetical protein